MSQASMIAEKHFAGRQCLGKRSTQEDAYAFAEITTGRGGEKGLLVVVADGMGGHAAGKEASELAVEKFVAAFQRESRPLAERFPLALGVANDAIAQAIDAEPDKLEGMGTTLLGAVLTAAGLEWISIGDSCLYLWRHGELRRLNADHSFRPVLREMVERGELTAAQAAASTLRNRLRSAMIGGELAMVDASPEPFPLRAGDLVLAGTDGIQTLSDGALAAVLAKYAAADAAEIATELLRVVLAAENPRQDNATLAILKL